MLSHKLAHELIKQVQELLRTINGINTLDLKYDGPRELSADEAFKATVAAIERVREAAKFIPGTIESLKGALIRDETMIAEGDKEAKRLLDEAKAKLATAEGTLAHLEKMDYKADRGDGNWEVNANFMGPAISALVAGLIETFRTTGATNNLEMKFRDGNPDAEENLGEFVLTLQRVRGKTPADQRKEAEDKLQKMREKLPELIKALGVSNPDMKIVTETLTDFHHTLDPDNTNG